MWELKDYHKDERCNNTWLNFVEVNDTKLKNYHQLHPKPNTITPNVYINIGCSFEPTILTTLNQIFKCLQQVGQSAEICTEGIWRQLFWKLHIWQVWMCFLGSFWTPSWENEVGQSCFGHFCRIMMIFLFWCHALTSSFFYKML